jgi:predicted ATPase/DNA-binding SARP family transcriptional activator
LFARLIEEMGLCSVVSPFRLAWYRTYILLGASWPSAVRQGFRGKGTIAVVNEKSSSVWDGGASTTGGLPDGAQATLCIFAFGRARVEKDGIPIDSPDWIHKTRELLFYLLSFPDGRTKEQIGLALWPEASTSQLRSSFHDSVFRLRRALGAKDWVVFEKRRYAFGGTMDYIYDVESFEKNISEAQRVQTEAPERAIQHLQEATELYRGHFLEDIAVEGEWVLERQDELRRSCQEAMLLLGELLGSLERHAEAASVYGRIIARDSYLEAAHRGLMRCYESLGERARALEHYRSLVETLRERLGTAPAPDTRALFEILLREGRVEPVASALPYEPPPSRTAASTTNNLPLQPTPLVGRERELEEVVERVRGGKERLLTLTGPGGAGKTRVALAAGSDLLRDFDDGVFFVSLASTHDAELVTSAIAGSLGVRESAERQLVEILEGYLRHKRLLLILDNFEQVLESAPVVETLLRSCAGLRVLATSRIPLNLYGEREYPVPPLAVPDSLLPHEDIERYDSVRLFVERARAVKSDFSVTEENAAAVASICARLDGLPLAIELAAARANSIAPRDMLSRLGNRLKLLRGGPRDMPARQRTLRDTIDWSYDLLEEHDRTLMRRLSVFAAGCTLEAIEEICDSKGGLDVLEGVESLLEKSLLRRNVVGGEARFEMLETVHEYAGERLGESGEAGMVQQAHAEYYLTLAVAADAGLKGPEQLEWMQRLETAHDDMRAALNWALRQNETELVLRLGGALWWFWFVGGHYSEGRSWLEEGLEMEGRGTLEARAMALAGVGALAYEQDELDRAEEACEEGLGLLTNREEQPGEARIYLLLSLGHVALDREDHDRATALLEDCLAVSRELGHGLGLAGSIMSLATVSHEKGDLERAVTLLEESMQLFRERDDKLGLAWCQINLGLAVCARGDTARAAKLTEEGVTLLQELGAGADSAIGLCNLGWMALLQEDPGRAAALFEESLDLAWDTGLHPIVLTTLEGLACVAGAEGERQRAARLWSAAQTLQNVMTIPRDKDWLAEADARISVVCSAMDEQSWEQASSRGRAMSLDEAVAFARERPTTY